MRPLFMDFPETAFIFNEEVSYMLGPALKVNPMVEANVAMDKDPMFKVYFPAGLWADLNNRGKISDYKEGTVETVPASQTATSVFLKEGQIIPIQR